MSVLVGGMPNLDTTTVCKCKDLWYIVIKLKRFLNLRTELYFVVHVFYVTWYQYIARAYRSRTEVKHVGSIPDTNMLHAAACCCCARRQV